jgi:uncharacterized protein YllA (UPF0747 family)
VILHEEKRIVLKVEMDENQALRLYRQLKTLDPHGERHEDVWHLIDRLADHFDPNGRRT